MENKYSLILSGSYVQSVISAYLDVNGKFQKINYYPVEGDSSSLIANIILLNHNKEPVTKLYNDTKYYFATVCRETNKYKMLKINDNSLFFTDEDIDYRTIYLEVPWGQDFKLNDIRGRSFILVNSKPLIEYLGTDIVHPRLSLSSITPAGLINMEDVNYLVKYEEPIQSQLDVKENKVVNSQKEKYENKDNYSFNIIFLIIVITLMVIISIVLICLVIYKKVYLPKIREKNISVDSKMIDIIT